MVPVSEACVMDLSVFRSSVFWRVVCLALTVLEGSIDGLRHQGRPKRQLMDDIEEWSGCSYSQLKEMSQDREQWRRKTIEWSSAVANRHRRWSTSEWVSECVCLLTCPDKQSDVRPPVPAGSGRRGQALCQSFCPRGPTRDDDPA